KEWIPVADDLPDVLGVVVHQVRAVLRRLRRPLLHGRALPIHAFTTKRGTSGNSYGSPSGNGRPISPCMIDKCDACTSTSATGSPSIFSFSRLASDMRW